MKFLKDIINGIGVMLGYIFSYRIYAKLVFLFKRLKSGWLSVSFKSFGKDSQIYNPMQLLGARFISVGSEVVIHDMCAITAIREHNGDVFNPSIIIKDKANIGAYNHITAIDYVEIGHGVLTGKWVTITDNSHGCVSEYMETEAVCPVDKKLNSPGKVIIGDNVWIGDKVTILPGVTVGNNCIIGANSVVSRSLPPYSLAVGSPARVIKELDK